MTGLVGNRSLGAYRDAGLPPGTLELWSLCLQRIGDLTQDSSRLLERGVTQGPAHDHCTDTPDFSGQIL